MTDTDECLAAIGFRDREPRPVCWRTERIGTAAPRLTQGAVEPALSPLLLQWRGVLRQARRPREARFYRISRIAG